MNIHRIPWSAWPRAWLGRTKPDMVVFPFVGPTEGQRASRAGLRQVSEQVHRITEWPNYRGPQKPSKPELFKNVLKNCKLPFTKIKVCRQPQCIKSNLKKKKKTPQGPRQQRGDSRVRATQPFPDFWTPPKPLEAPLLTRGHETQLWESMIQLSQSSVPPTRNLKLKGFR